MPFAQPPSPGSNNCVREGEFHARGYKAPTNAVRDLSNIDRPICDGGRERLPRITLAGTMLPAQMPAAAEVFEAGAMKLVQLLDQDAPTLDDEQRAAFFVEHDSYFRAN